MNASLKKKLCSQAVDLACALVSAEIGQISRDETMAGIKQAVDLCVTIGKTSVPEIYRGRVMQTREELIYLQNELEDGKPLENYSGLLERVSLLFLEYGDYLTSTQKVLDNYQFLCLMSPLDVVYCYKW